MEFTNKGGDRLFEEIQHGLGDQLWCDRYVYALGPSEKLSYSWESFCRFIKEERRFFFLDRERGEGDEALDPGTTLRTIFEYAQRVNLTRKLPVDRLYYRVRKQREGEAFTTVEQLGPPPTEHAIQSNRMSPPGIVMTYVSEAIETALRETAAEAGTYAVGSFRALREITVLDLAELPPIPSLFAEIPRSLEYDPRRTLIFLHEIARDISRPIAHDDHIHVEYVPTQVVTEYMRTVQTEDGRQLDGIRYRSARHDDGISIVLFADQRNFVRPSDAHWEPHAEKWLELVSSTLRAVTGHQIENWQQELT